MTNLEILLLISLSLVLVISWRSRNKRRTFIEQVNTHLRELRDQLKASEIAYRTVKKQNDSLVHQLRQADTDEVTGLLRRSRFDEALDAQMRTNKLRRPEVCVISFDIDNFKQVNDQNGHPFGDVVLRAVSDQIQSCVRPLDVVARYGGEEIVVLAYCDLVGGIALAERIRKGVQSLTFDCKPGFRVTLSGGISTTRGDTALDIMNRVDDRLYRAKNSGRNKVIAGT